MSLPLVRSLAALVVAAGLLLTPELARTQERRSAEASVPGLRPPGDLGEVDGNPISRIEVRVQGAAFSERVVLRRVRVGEPLTREVARRAMRELTDSGRFAAVEVAAESDRAGGVVLILKVVPRRIVGSLRVRGTPLGRDMALRALGVREGDELTAADLSTMAERLRAEHVRRGFPTSSVTIEPLATDDPLRVVLVVDVSTGRPTLIGSRLILLSPEPVVPGLLDVAESYAVGAGDRADSLRLEQENEALARRLRERGWFLARVQHELVSTGSGSQLLRVRVDAGPLVRLRFEGNRHFDSSQLLSAVEISDETGRAPEALGAKLRRFYQRHGFLDVEVEVTGEPSPQARYAEYVFRVREGELLRIAERRFPCLLGRQLIAQVSAEIDSFLDEELPGGAVLGPVDPDAASATLGPTSGRGRRVKPFVPDPYTTYVPDVYERATKHVQDLFRSRGYLSAQVGPVQLVRRRCRPQSPPSVCVPLGPEPELSFECRTDSVGLPLEEPLRPELSCERDVRGHVRCEPSARLYIPVKLGPQTLLYDVGFDGNKSLVETELLEAADLALGDPVSQVEVEAARRRLLDAYAEEGFAFAEVEAVLDLSLDRTRGRIRFLINERERVRVARIAVRGARRTKETLIRGRVALEQGGLYRRSLVRKTEERLATLGVFSSVTVGLEDPTVPAREKVVVITVQERKAQYLDVRPGFSSGEGFRFTFEYGHRNLASEAIELTLRTQLGFLPSAFIIEDDVRRKYEELNLAERLERRNTASLELPEFGLGPLFRLNLELVDVRDNARDFGLTKDASMLTLGYRPTTRLSVNAGLSLERNEAAIFGEEQKGALEQYVRQNPEQRNRFRVPEGVTLAGAARLSASWDRRDNPLDATRGTLLSASAELVRATPLGEDSSPSDTASVFAASESLFLRGTQRTSAYLRLSDDGLALAASFRWGLIAQLRTGSRTYPDRLFFLGGVDSLRGFLQDSLVPEDIARELLRADSALTLREVVVRGGDFFVNPRLELRIPLSGSVQTALFIDSGNIWKDPALVADTLRLRYAAGTGLRIATPIGPLVFDYGLNLERVLDRLLPGRTSQRSWEDLGAFHFSIGVF